jgi:hypothetical protein
MAAELHLAENTLALHLFLQRLESLVDIVIADENLHALFLFALPRMPCVLDLLWLDVPEPADPP